MTKQHTRLFFLVGTALFTVIFLFMTIDTHRQVATLTNADQLTPDVVAGQHVWHRKNCVNCHTLLGEGAYYAPDLTKITDHRGEAYLTAFLQDPSRFYSEEVHRRLMPNPNLSADDIAHVIAFLRWIAAIDNQGWPPRPIRVTGSLQGSGAAPLEGAPASDDPVAIGQDLFKASPPGCVACHSTTPGLVLVGPSMAGLVARAVEIIASDAYKGTADTPEAYVRESILHPSAHVPDDRRFGAAGVSLMPGNLEQTLEPAQVDALVSYLMTLR